MRKVLLAYLLLFLSAVSEVFAGQVVVSWDFNSTGETGFEVQRAPGNTSADADFAAVAFTAPGVTSYTDLSVATGFLYSYRIRAVYGTALSGFSNIATMLAIPTITTSNTVTIAIKPGESYTVKGSTNKTLQGSKTINVAPGKQAVFVGP